MFFLKQEICKCRKAEEAATQKLTEANDFDDDDDVTSDVTTSNVTTASPVPQTNNVQTNNATATTNGTPESPTTRESTIYW